MESERARTGDVCSAVAEPGVPLCPGPRAILGIPGRLGSSDFLPTGPVALATERGAGRAFVWGDEWVTFDSEWWARPEIRRFWINVLGWVERVR